MMTRGIFDNRKSLGRGTIWVCGICGKKIKAHTTTINLATLNHRKMEVRQGLREMYNPYKTYGDKRIGG